MHDSPIEPSSDQLDEMHRRGLDVHTTNHIEAAADDIERAWQYHAEHGVWPPDPLLDEVADMRRRIMAEHGNDWRRVLAWYGELDEQRRQREAGAQKSDPPGKSAA